MRSPVHVVVFVLITPPFTCNNVVTDSSLQCILSYSSYSTNITEKIYCTVGKQLEYTALFGKHSNMHLPVLCLIMIKYGMYWYYTMMRFNFAIRLEHYIRTRTFCSSTCYKGENKAISQDFQ